VGVSQYMLIHKFTSTSIHAYTYNGKQSLLHFRLHSTHLLRHNVHGNLGTEEDAHQVDLDHKLNLTYWDIHEGPASTVDTGVVDPVLEGATLLLGKFSEFLDTLGIAHIALGVVDPAVGMTGGQSLGGRRAVLDVADDDVVSTVHELSSVGEADTPGTAGDDDAALDGTGGGGSIRHAQEG